MVRPLVLVAALAVVGVVVVALPDLLVAPVARMVVVGLLGVGVWVSVRRIGVIDLAAGGAVAAGAYLGGVSAGLLGLPAAGALASGVAAGALVSAIGAAVTARVGRVLGSLATLAIGAGVVGAAASWSAAGGPAGYHAVPLLSVTGRVELAVAAIALIGVSALLIRVRRGPVLARAAVAIRAPHVAASVGRYPWVDAGVGGGVAGVVIGAAGALLALLDGSVIPAAYGLELSAVLVLAALVGGSTVLAGALGALLLLGPALAAPGYALAALPMSAGAIAGVALLAWRPGGLLHRDPWTVADGEAPAPVGGGDDVAVQPAPSPDPVRLVVVDAPLPDGRTVSFVAEPGEVVALAGPNGSGKSTLLAMIGGQLEDGGRVRFDDPDDGATATHAPRGATRRARRGIARTWQRPPDIDPVDDVVVAARGPVDRDAADRVAARLGDHVTSAAGRDLVRLAARRPRVALLDEPAAHLPAELVVGVLIELAGSGTTVVVAEHRAEVLESADRVVDVTRPDRGGRG